VTLLDLALATTTLQHLATVFQDDTAVAISLWLFSLAKYLVDTPKIALPEHHAVAMGSGDTMDRVSVRPVPAPQPDDQGA